MLLVHAFAPWLAKNVLTEVRAADLLKVMSYSLIPASVHACFNGYYYGKKDSVIPSLCQILEQVFRVAGTYIIYLVLSNQNLPLLALHAVWGLVISEIAGLLVSFTAFLLQNPDVKHRTDSLPIYPLVAMALPLTLNHVLITLTHSFENLRIPQQ